MDTWEEPASSCYTPPPQCHNLGLNPYWQLDWPACKLLHHQLATKGSIPWLRRPPPWEKKKVSRERWPLQLERSLLQPGSHKFIAQIAEANFQTPPICCSFPTRHTAWKTQCVSDTKVWNCRSAVRRMVASIQGPPATHTDGCILSLWVLTSNSGKSHEEKDVSSWQSTSAVWQRQTVCGSACDKWRVWIHTCGVFSVFLPFFLSVLEKKSHGAKWI